MRAKDDWPRAKPGLSVYGWEGAWADVPGAERAAYESSYASPMASWSSLKRRHHFLLGRYCAAKARVELDGVVMDSLPMQADGTVAWPMGLVGSITHTQHFARAVIGSARQWRGIGIDAEMVPDSPRRLEAMRAKAVSEDELALCAGVAQRVALTLVFSAKESLYKCLYPLCGRYKGFEAARLLMLDVTRGVFELALTEDWGLHMERDTRFSGEFCLSGKRVETLVCWQGAAEP